MQNYVGLTLQTRGAEHYVLKGGKGEGMNFLFVRNGLGLEAFISLDRAGDLSRVTFKGENMGYFSPSGYVAPQYYEKEGFGFLKSFTGGFFTTCGLTAVGSPCTDEGEELGLHGTISNIPAQLLAQNESDEGIEITVRVSDTAIFGRKLILDRKYFFSYTENKISLIDTVTNEGDNKEPFMILYHCNMGYPLLKENSFVKIPNNSVKGRDENAQNYVASALEMEKPTKNYAERCYFYDVAEKDGRAKVGIYNPDIDLGTVISYKKNTLPCFTEWKMMGNREYALGLEPGNCTPEGRDVLRKENRLEFIDSKESKSMELDFIFSKGKTTFEEEF